MRRRPGGFAPGILTIAIVAALVDASASRATPRAPATSAASFTAASAPTYGIAMREAAIPMPDGVRLAADLWMPQGGRSGERYPVLLEYLPYRKTEARGDRYGLYAYFVKRGYVVARVDIRGTGNSEGRLIPYEYSDIEQVDGEAVIAWLAKQPFANGAVGMFGISWGGFNALHMAMRNPPALKAIIAVDATDDLYQDDVHFMDGGMHVDSWEMSMDLANAMPGAPDYTIDERLFADRFDTPPWMLTYKRQQRDGPFWDRTALNKRYESIKIPTFVIGGWYDGYRDAVPRLLANLKAPVKAMVGPWSHCWPHDSYPKPGMEWRHEAVRWFDQHLKGKDTGIMQEPRFAVYVRRWHPPGPRLAEAPGEWRWEEGWPIARGRAEILYPRADRTLQGNPSVARTSESLRYVPSTGVEIGGPVMWWGDVAPDQRPSDAFSLTYDTAPLGADLEILGLPHAVLEVAADAPAAHWFARLSDVAPDGTVTLVAGAGFNGQHRESARAPKPIDPGKLFTIDVEMHFTSWVFPKGHRLRLAVSNAMWPMIWPSPYPMTTTLAMGGGSPTRLVLPVIPESGVAGARAVAPTSAAALAPAAPPPTPGAPRFLPPEADPVLDGFGVLETGTASGYGEIESIDRDAVHGGAKVVATNGGGTRYPWGTERNTESIRHETSDTHPEMTSVLGEYRTEVALKGRVLVFEARLTFKSNRDTFFYTYVRRFLENGVLVREKTWTDAIPRDGV